MDECLSACGRSWKVPRMTGMNLSPAIGLDRITGSQDLELALLFEVAPFISYELAKKQLQVAAPVPE
jgi:hypothetical protein